MRLTKEIDKDKRTTEFIGQLWQVWEASVRATHHFLTEQDIQSIKQQGKAVLYDIDILVVAFEENIPIGFIGIQEKKIEALFLSPDQIGKGWGRLLIDLAIQQYGALYIDVNEQNTQAEAIYRHLGFETYQYDETDEQGNPFPILHMKLKRHPNIHHIPTDKKQYLSLLLLADEQESMIDRYLERGELYVMQDEQIQEPLAVAVVTMEGEGVCELKNLAVSPSYQRKGLGRQMVEYLFDRYKDSCHTMFVGTGDSQQTVGFYRSCGFTYSHTIPDFFTRHYDHPIVEEGKVLRDMIYFRKELKR
ncbi:hypothetical protein B5F77_13990 [Parabacteroides sp. An277]|uniref:GNAT family N-acetyltransferase n=1 Tax=Parabacteroides sp. An277 TaxID=1965619 RepID=UPI000B36B4F3|nr:hypothetical protein B5F77_13990 [Parabacteroides sp. An277]